jgi:hypothetical protein
MAPDAKRHTPASQSEETLPIERPAAASLPSDFSAAKQAIELLRKSKWKDAAALAASISDPAAQKLIEWALLRSADSQAGFERYVAFLNANPDWPGALLRRRAEARLWQERRDGTTVRRVVGNEPASSVGRLALARALMNEGDRDRAAREVQAVWRSVELSAEMESAILDTFTDMLSPADHVVRMDRRSILFTSMTALLIRSCLLAPPTGAAALQRQPAPSLVSTRLFCAAAAIGERRGERGTARCGHPLFDRRARPWPTLRSRPR